VGIKRVLTFLHTHSVSDNGDLHAKKDEAVTAKDVRSPAFNLSLPRLTTLNQFLRRIFGSALPRFSATIPSMLVILSCGGLFKNAKSFSAVSRLADRWVAMLNPYASDTNLHSSKIFQHIIGFGGNKFLPHLATCFLQKLVHKHFIEHYSVERFLPHLLNEEESLGPHTNIFHMTYQVATEHVWYHNQIRPLGIPLPLQCPHCGNLCSLSVKYYPHRVDVNCKQKTCRRIVRTIPRDEWKYNSDKPMSMGSGWCFKEHWGRDNKHVE
jgi:hypothetical protein